MAGYATRSLAFHNFPLLFLNYHRRRHLVHNCTTDIADFLVDFDPSKNGKKDKNKNYTLSLLCFPVDKYCPAKYEHFLYSKLKIFQVRLHENEEVDKYAEGKNVATN